MTEACPAHTYELTHSPRRRLDETRSACQPKLKRTLAQRVAAALDFATGRSLEVEKADAADWVEREILKPAAPGMARMFYHTVVWQYLADDTKRRITAALERAGDAATEQAPLAWFRFENDGGEGGPMCLTLWPWGETRDLGRADFHGRWVRWV